MHARPLRCSWLVLPLLFGACAASPRNAVAPGPEPARAPQSTHRYLEEGAWRVSGAANASFANTDVGDVETTTLGLSATGGRMVSPNVLVEGLVSYQDSSTDFGPNEIDQVSLELGVGARYYFLVEGNTYPYLRGQLGIALVDLDTGDGEDDDSSPFIGVGVGAETFLTSTIALDYGLRFDYAFDIFDEDLTDLSLFFGLSLWF